MKKALALAFALSLSAARVPSLLAQASAAPAPAPRWKPIFAERFRFETWDNAVNLDDKAADGFGYTRNKTTLGVEWRPSAAWEVAAKATNEFRVWLAPKDRPFTWNEAFFDNLYVRWNGGGRVPLTVTAGRQDIFLGEGFVVADGNPLDGSRSFYFNAVRADWRIAKAHALIAFVHKMPEKDTWLPVLHGQSQALVEQPESAAALYYQGTNLGAKTDLYYVRKTIAASGARPGSGIDTLGARFQRAIAGPLALTLEGALQGGSFGGAKRRAAGGIVHLDWSPKEARVVRTVTLGGIALSGDDPATARDEAWDPLFSRWPKWSEGYIYTLIREKAVAYWSNLTSLYGAVALDFGTSANATLHVHRLGALEPAPAGAFPGGTGRRRGTLVVGRLNFAASPRLSGHLVWESFRPGDFYFAGASGFNWLRFELLFRY